MSEAHAHDAAMDDPALLSWSEEEERPVNLRDRLISVLMVVVIAGWTIAYALTRLDQMKDGASGSLWLSWAAEWVIPVLLLAVVWLLAARNGSGEQARFASAAAMLSRESAELETRLITVNRELSLARDFIASQSRDLESLGRVAAERLNTSAQTLQALIEQNSAEVDRIGQVGGTAINNMEKLRDQLPVLANAARDMTNQIGNAGNVAAEQLEKLVARFEQLDQFGDAGERHVELISARMTETLEMFDSHAREMGDMASGQFGMLQRSSEEFRNLLKMQDDEAMRAFEGRAERLTNFLQQRNEQLVKIEEVASKGMRERLEAMIAQNDQLLRAMVERRNEASSGVNSAIEALEARLSEAIQKVAKVDAVALDNARSRLAALADESARIEAAIGEQSANFDADLQRRRDSLHERELAALAALEERLAAFDTKLLTREEGRLADVTQMVERGEALAERLAVFDAEIARLGQQASAARDEVGGAAELLAGKLEHSRAVLAENQQAMAAMLETAGTLGEAINGASALASGDLGTALGAAGERIEGFRASAAALGELVESAESRGAALAGHVETAREKGEGTLGLLEQLETRLAELAERSSAVTGQTREELQAAFAMLSSSTAATLQDLREGQTEAIREIAGNIAQQSNAAIAEALREHAAETIAEIETSARTAGEAGRETTAHLRDQLAMVNQLTMNLEQRVAAARDKAQEQMGDDFARRMALITEALNSGAIDIAKAFDNDVADTQWANYLRGDRGIFTRRAVRLLDKAESRAVFDHYEADGYFRETVNRYIHDFEAMLRSVLSTRDGNALAVTLLSSDVGKLYVCLAQAIDRLRD